MTDEHPPFHRCTVMIPPETLQGFKERIAQLERENRRLAHELDLAAAGFAYQRQKAKAFRRRFEQVAALLPVGIEPDPYGDDPYDAMDGGDWLGERAELVEEMGFSIPLDGSETLWVSLHSKSPVGGDQSTHEVSYEGYSRQSLAGSEFLPPGPKTFEVIFPMGTGSADYAVCFGIGEEETGPGRLLGVFAFSLTIECGRDIRPIVTVEYNP